MGGGRLFPDDRKPADVAFSLWQPAFPPSMIRPFWHAGFQSGKRWVFINEGCSGYDEWAGQRKDVPMATKAQRK